MKNTISKFGGNEELRKNSRKSSQFPHEKFNILSLKASLVKVWEICSNDIQETVWIISQILLAIAPLKSAQPDRLSWHVQPLLHKDSD